MYNQPKTPSRVRARSEAKTPLTPSILSSLNNISLIPNSDSFQRQSSGGVIRKGGVESRLEVVTRDYVPPPPKYEVKRSKSTPATVRIISKCKRSLG